MGGKPRGELFRIDAAAIGEGDAVIQDRNDASPDTDGEADEVFDGVPAFQFIASKTMPSPR
jgi:hypothetical protein